VGCTMDLSHGELKARQVEVINELHSSSLTSPASVLSKRTHHLLIRPDRSHVNDTDIS
jgi:hypothetical protein